MTPRREGISPKDFAAAIGVSESSIKRWVDQGLLRAVRTAGGHRRIAPDEAARWMREHRVQPVQPERLGLDVREESTPSGGLAAHVENFHALLLAGKAEEVRSLALRLFIGGHSVAAIGDELIAPAMNRIGTLWESGDEGIFIEHRATDIAVHVIKDLDGVVHEQRPRVRGLVAIGAAPPADPHLLPSMLASATVAEVGFHVTNAGPDLPIAVLESSAHRLHAQLVWVSVSSPPTAAVASDIVAMVERLVAADIHVAIGGRWSRAVNVVPNPKVHVGGNLVELAAWARALAPAPQRPMAVSAR